jgi:N-acetyltransferase
VAGSVENLTLVGTTVRLEPLAPRHVGDLVASANEDRSSYAFTSVPHDTASMDRYVAGALRDRDAGWAVPFAVMSHLSGRAIGSTRFLDIDDWLAPFGGVRSADSPRRGVPRGVEIGATWYAASAQRSVVNSESKLLLLSHAFDTWGVERVTLKTDARNERSRLAIARIGATYEGIRRAHGLASDGTIRDSAYYSIVRTEWPDVRSYLISRVDGGSHPFAAWS